MINGESQFQRSAASPGASSGWMSTISPLTRS
jgi:hypothetical protein